MEAQRSPGESVSGFIPRHMEQPGLPPLEAGGPEDLVEALGLGGGLHLHRAGDDQGPHPGGDVAAPQHVGGGPEVFEAAVGARAEEDGVDGDVADGGAGLEAHVLQGPGGGVAGVRLGEGVGVGDRLVDADDLAGVGAPGDVGAQLGGVDHDLLVEGGAVVGGQRAPGVEGGLPGLALGGVGPALEVGEGGVVGGDQPRPGAGLDRHVADRHPALHRQGPDGRAPVLDDGADAAAGADAADDRRG